MTGHSVKAFQLGNAIESISEKGPKKALQKKYNGQHKGAQHEKAETQRMTLRRGKNLAFGKHTFLEKESVRSKVPH